MSSVYVASSYTRIGLPPIIRPEDFKYTFLGDEMNKFSGNKDYMYSVDAGVWGRITVLNRRTGYMGGMRDVESGYTDTLARPDWHAREGMPLERSTFGRDFWLASGRVDARQEVIDRGCMHWLDLVQWIKRQANTCVGDMASDLVIKHTQLHFDISYEDWEKSMRRYEEDDE